MKSKGVKFMEEKKAVKVRLGTVVCIFIIIILMVALCAVYYLGFVKNSEEIIALKDEINVLKSQNNVSQNEKVEIKTDDVATKKFKPGEYRILPDLQILGEEYFYMADYGVETISFSNDGTFSADLGWGIGISGNYEVSNDTISCIINEYSGEYSPDQETDGKIVFKIKNASDNSVDLIEIIEISDSFKVKETISSETGGWTLTNNDKDMPLYPLMEGIKFFQL